MPIPTSAPIRRVAVLTLGCKLNQADSEAIARELVARGCDVIDRPSAADAYIINTCSVTHVADRKSRHLVRLARRLGAPGAPVALVGCYPETAGLEVARRTGADLVLGNRDKLAVVESLLRHPRAASEVPVRPLRTRAFVKAQEGCNDVCAFCIVPRTRGREVSVPIERVVAEVARREAAGVQEVVITGTQLGAYGRDIGARLPDLIRALLAETSAPRIRCSSLQPQDITPELVGLWEDPRLCRHFHLALQSGCDATLARMRRRYDTRMYREAVELIRAAVPGAAITTDVIVGFPGETDEEFEQSLAFCEEMAFAGMHVFPYSRRPGTTADKLPGHVPPEVKRERVRRMLALAEASARRFRMAHVGRVVSVLWEDRARGTEEGDVWEGLTDDYVRVRARSRANLMNRVTGARVLADGPGYVEAEALV
ncbi:MAG TPA: tRNA (N(6)-L-threonylcarbamoyladenosine(37)-C(2))-methylthiotransferase MtaB [Dehalococcoidia bacterium]|nr:tRNA (N(6)-L-threonylcarbamoyladenosine(37)-C(2))-methylthiotransferase MtaB [Dehalococcoidia bacterium]